MMIKWRWEWWCWCMSTLIPSGFPTATPNKNKVQTDKILETGTLVFTSNENIEWKTFIKDDLKPQKLFDLWWHSMQVKMNMNAIPRLHLTISIKINNDWFCHLVQINLCVGNWWKKKYFLFWCRHRSRFHSIFVSQLWSDCFPINLVTLEHIVEFIEMYQKIRKPSSPPLPLPPTIHITKLELFWKFSLVSILIRCGWWGPPYIIQNQMIIIKWFTCVYVWANQKRNKSKLSDYKLRKQQIKLTAASGSGGNFTLFFSSFLSLLRSDIRRSVSLQCEWVGNMANICRYLYKYLP